MTIFAFTPNTLEHRIRIKEPLTDDDVLAYSSSFGTFVNKKIADILTTSVVVSAENRGSHNTVSIVANVSAGTIGFRGLYGKSGINVRVDGNDIIFEVNRHEGNVSDTSYSIIFDVDGNENNSVFTVETAISSSAYFLNITPFPNVTYSNVSFHNTSANAFIYIDGLTPSASFFETFMIIKVSGSIEQDGVYKIVAISAYDNGMRLFVQSIFSSSSTLGFLQNNIEFSQVVGVVERNSSLPVPPYDSSKFYTLHIWKPVNLGEFYAGRTIRIDNSLDGILDGIYIVKQVISSSTYFDTKGSMIIFDYRSPLPNLSSSPYYVVTSANGSFSLNATGNVVSTGFYIEKDGTVHARRMVISALPLSDYDVSNKIYVKSEISALKAAEVSSLRTEISSLSERVDKVDRKINQAKIFWLINSRF